METLSKALEEMTRTEKVRDAIDRLAGASSARDRQTETVEVAGRKVVVRRAFSVVAATSKPKSR